MTFAGLLLGAVCAAAVCVLYAMRWERRRVVRREFRDVARFARWREAMRERN